MSNNQRSGPARAVVRTALAAAIALSFSQRSQADFVQVINVYADPFTHVGAVSVTSDGRCSLIEAIKTANNTSIPGNTDCGSPSGLPHVIEMPIKASFALTTAIDFTGGANGLPSITSDIAINGHRSTISRSTLAGTSELRILHVSTSGTLKLSNITLANGRALDSLHHLTAYGACISNHGTLTLKGSTLTGCRALLGGAIENTGSANIYTSTLLNNTAQRGGAIWDNQGILSLQNSTISNNTATLGYGGGIYVSRGMSSSTAFPVTIANSTISGNTAVSGGGIAINSASEFSASRIDIVNSTIARNKANAMSGGGIYNHKGKLTFSNSIVAISSSNSLDCAGDQTSHGTGVNIFDDTSCLPAGGNSKIANPKLGPLSNNGGPTQTHTLLTGSPAIDAANDVICKGSFVQNRDQRGYSRNEGAHCDIGAYELDQTTFFVVPASNGKTVIFGL